MRLGWISALGLLGLAAATSWWLRGWAEDMGREPPGRLETGPSYYMEDFATAIMGADGLPERRLQAHYYVRFQPRGDGQLARPRMTFYSDGENPLWMARSKRGWVSPDGDELRLSRRVRLRRPASPGRADLYVRTEELLVRSDEETARSELPVYATLGPHEMRGTGMIADLHSGRLQLLSEVEGRYEE